MTPPETPSRPLGIVMIAICLMAFSAMPMASLLFGFMIDLIKYGPGVLYGGAVLLFQLFVMALPGLLGWGLWNLQNSARVTCLIVLAIVAVIGILLLPRVGIFSIRALLYLGYLLWGVAVAFYLTRPSVKRAFQPDIEVINFKNL
jgi:hypothetical protein